MKKFSKVKYFGAVAAALLAVAPIAAPVVSQVASPAIAQAATQIDTDAQNLVNNTFKSTVNTTFGSATAANVAGLNQSVPYNTIADANGATVGGATAYQFISNNDSKWQSGAFANYRVSISLDGNATGATGSELANILTTKPQKSYTATVNVYKANDANTVIATKTITVNVASYLKASFPALTATVGDAVAPLNNVADAAGALKVTNTDNQAVNVYGSDFDATSIGWTFGTNPVGNHAGIGNYISNLSAENQTTNSSRFIKNGTLYQAFKIQNNGTTNSSLAATLTNYASSIRTAMTDSSATIVAKGGVVSDGTNVYVVRAVNVQATENDQAYKPVVKYTSVADSSSQNAVTTTYYDGDTISLANPLNYVAGSTASDGFTYDQGARDIVALAQFSPASGADPAYNKFQAYDNSIKGGGLNVSLGNPARYTVNGNPFTVDGITTALQGLVKNPYISQTVKVPVTITNTRGYVATINIPITIGTNVGTPIATEFTGYTTITKGSKFDPLADVQFKNSSTDNSVIPDSRINVSSNVDITTPGTYTVTYTVTNAAGKSATFTRTVVVTAGDLTESNASGVVYINNASGAKVYSDTATSKETGNTLDNTTAWKYSSVVKDAANKIVAYNLGGKQYVKAADVATSPVKAQAGVFTVHYPANAKWSIAVYNSNLKVQKLIPANSTWITFGTKTLKDGKSYYNLGGNQWVRTDYGFWNAK
ncbi:SLAP domain-containing protein [Schleiferilactobacillus harbinensis]|uniref:DUF5011 domain-containing protein n=1 Tax=Schleiferilactobacillus harbinensis TaxID=304207 RepID=A0A5P8M882_9LACO|nr:SLAP domain-containing protein [Schleiferilactobacillus harbinensis]QFR24221.1 DUF5011 domain-containing protein [Schleiferilactobacillus harbinensis]